MFRDHIMFKRLLNKEIQRGDELNKTIESLSSQLKKKLEEISDSELKKLISEKRGYIHNIMTISEEVKNTLFS